MSETREKGGGFGELMVLPRYLVNDLVTPGTQTPAFDDALEQNHAWKRSVYCSENVYVLDFPGVTRNSGTVSAPSVFVGHTPTGYPSGRNAYNEKETWLCRKSKLSIQSSDGYRTPNIDISTMMYPGHIVSVTPKIARFLMTIRISHPEAYRVYPTINRAMRDFARSMYRGIRMIYRRMYHALHD